MMTRMGEPVHAEGELGQRQSRGTMLILWSRWNTWYSLDHLCNSYIFEDFLNRKWSRTKSIRRGHVIRMCGPSWTQLVLVAMLTASLG